MARRFTAGRWPAPALEGFGPTDTHEAVSRRMGAAAGQGAAPSFAQPSPASPSSASPGSAPSHLASLNPASLKSALSFGCLFIPQFAVWAARFNAPSIGERPLLIHRGGKIVEACAACLQAGVRAGWTLSRAQALCTDALPSAFDAAGLAYAWDVVLGKLYGLSPQLETVRPGLLFLAPPAATSPRWMSFMKELAGLADEWGARVVVASDRTTAEVAAHVSKFGFVRLIHPGREQSFLSEVPCKVLMQVGLSEGTAQRLGWFGFKSVADLRRLTREQIANQFADPGAPRDAALLGRCARAGTAGADRQPVQSYQLPPVCKSRVVFEQAGRHPGEWEAALWEAVEQSAAQLNGMGAGAIALSVAVKTGTRTGSKLLRESTSSRSTLRRCVQDLMEAMVEPDDEVQVVEVVLSRLAAHGVQSTLFDGVRFAGLPRRVCPPRLLSALRNLEARYTGTLWRWLLRDEYAPEPEAQYARIPLVECADGNEPRVKTEVRAKPALRVKAGLRDVLKPRRELEGAGLR